MKKIVMALLTSVIFSSVITCHVNAQMFLASVSTSKSKTIPALANFINNEKLAEEKIAVAGGGDDKNVVSKASLKETKANLKAIKANLMAMKAKFRATESFKKEFKNVSNANWNFNKDVISATFYNDNSRTSVIYDRKGAWVNTVAYCNQNKVPQNIKDLIEIEYPDYQITGMHEINEGHITFEIVYLENATGYKQISIFDGITYLYKEFTKQ